MGFVARSPLDGLIHQSHDALESGQPRNDPRVYDEATYVLAVASRSITSREVLARVPIL